MWYFVPTLVPEGEHAPGDLVRHIRGHEPGKPRRGRSDGVIRRGAVAARPRSAIEGVLERDERRPPSGGADGLEAVRANFSSIFGKKSGCVGGGMSPICKASNVSGWILARPSGAAPARRRKLCRRRCPGISAAYGSCALRRSLCRANHQSRANDSRDPNTIMRGD